MDIDAELARVAERTAAVTGQHPDDVERALRKLAEHYAADGNALRRLDPPPIVHIDDFDPADYLGRHLARRDG